MIRLFLTALSLAAGLTAAVADPAPSRPAPGSDAHAAARRLIAEAKCEACHARKVGGDGTSMYTRENRIVKTRSRLATQISLCNSELNLALFPDDEVAIAAYLNATYYRFE